MPKSKITYDEEHAAFGSIAVLRDGELIGHFVAEPAKSYDEALQGKWTFKAKPSIAGWLHPALLNMEPDLLVYVKQSLECRT